MDPSILLHAVVATWLLISSPGDARAYRPADDLPAIEQPRSGRFRMDGRFAAGPEAATVSGEGAFAGPDRMTLYIGTLGANTPAGENWATPQGVRNIAATIYAAPMLATGPRR